MSAFNPILQNFYYIFKTHADTWISSSPMYFSVYSRLSEFTYFRGFPVICWSSLRTEISVSISIGDELYSPHHILYFSFLRKPLCWCYLAIASKMLSSSSPAKLVYYIMYIIVIIIILSFSAFGFLEVKESRAYICSQYLTPQSLLDICCALAPHRHM